MKPFDETIWWNDLMKTFDENIWCNHWMKTLDENIGWKHWMKTLDENIWWNHLIRQSVSRFNDLDDRVFDGVVLVCFNSKSMLLCWISRPDSRNVMRHRISTLWNFTTTGAWIHILVKYSMIRENKWGIICKLI